MSGKRTRFETLPIEAQVFYYFLNYIVDTCATRDCEIEKKLFVRFNNSKDYAKSLIQHLEALPIMNEVMEERKNTILNIKDDDGFNLLDSHLNDLNITSRLLELGVNIRQNGINSYNYHTIYSTLASVIYNDRPNIDVIRLLLEKGADVNGTSGEDEIPTLSIAYYHSYKCENFEEIVGLLLEHPNINVNLCTIYDIPPLMFAMQSECNLNIIKQLVAKNPDLSDVWDEGKNVFNNLDCYNDSKIRKQVKRILKDLRARQQTG
jgi:ankyrin repeat protein